MYHDRHEPCAEVRTWLHGPPFQNHMQTDLPPTCLEQFLTALQEAVSWAVIPTKSPRWNRNSHIVHFHLSEHLLWILWWWLLTGTIVATDTCCTHIRSISAVSEEVSEGNWKVRVLKEALSLTIVWPSGNLPVSTFVRQMLWWLRAETLEPACLGLNVGLTPSDLCDLKQVTWTLCSLISERGVIIEGN